MHRRWSNKSRIGEMLAGGTENKAFQHEISKFSVVWKMGAATTSSASASASTASKSAADLPSSVTEASASAPAEASASTAATSSSDLPHSDSAAAASASATAAALPATSLTASDTPLATSMPSTFWLRSLCGILFRHAVYMYSDQRDGHRHACVIGCFDELASFDGAPGRLAHLQHLLLPVRDRRRHQSAALYAPLP